MKQGGRERAAAALAVLGLVLCLACGDYALHRYTAGSGQEETDRLSSNEFQYELLLQEEQSVLEELDGLEDVSGDGAGRSEQARMELLKEELHRIRVEKSVLEARMQEESFRTQAVSLEIPGGAAAVADQRTRKGREGEDL